MFLAAVLAFTDVTVVDVEKERLRPHVTVVVDGASIASITASARARVPSGATLVDGRGKYLIPGLIDAHVHLTILEKGALARDVLLPAYARWGVTGVRDMGGDIGQLARLRAAVADGTIEGPRIVTPGPFLDGAGEPPFTLVVPSPEAAAPAVDRVLAEGADFVKVQAALTPAAWRAIVAATAAKRKTVAGHVPEAVSAFDVAASGQSTVEHVSPVLPGDAGVMMACTSDEEGLRRERVELSAYLAKDDADPALAKARQRAWQKRIVDAFDVTRCGRLARVLARHRVVWIPTQAWSESFAPMAPEPSPPAVDWGDLPQAIRDRWTTRRAKIAAASTPEDFAARRAMFDASVRLVRFLHERGVAIAAGTDGTDFFDLPGDALHREMELLVAAGFTPAQALAAATKVAAGASGWADCGTIAPGKRADLVLLDGNPLVDIAATRRIAGVVLAGRWRPARLESSP